MERTFKTVLAFFAFITALTLFASARNVYLSNEDFEDGIRSFIPLTASSGAVTLSSDSTYGTVLEFTQKSQYAHVGIKVPLTMDV